ncbi:MAG: hypothetical protein Q9M24_06725 [Mariprofundaceae bacterium]|nr:hypothetical protein [Mariprofundaceae bacterium]
MKDLEDLYFGQGAVEHQIKLKTRQKRLMRRIYAGVIVALISSIFLALNVFAYLMFMIACISLISVELAYGSKRKVTTQMSQTQANLNLNQDSLDKLNRKHSTLDSLIQFMVLVVAVLIGITVFTDGYEAIMFLFTGCCMVLIILPVCRRKVLEEKIALIECQVAQREFTSQ